MDTEQIAQVRRFNRIVTRRVGALDEDYLGRGRPLAESRLLFEIGPEGAGLRELRARLSLDSGYLSRLLRGLQSQQLVRLQPAPGDARARQAVLTAKGRREFAELDRRSQTFAGSLLDALAPAQRTRLVAAMEEVERLLRASDVEIAVADAAGDEARTCIDAYLRELDALFDGGFDAARSPSADPAELVPPAGVMLLARIDGQAVGCGVLRRIAPGVGEIKRMWVAPSARGLGIAQRLLDALEQHAVRFGLPVVRLDTNRSLEQARALYLRNGYSEIAAYNDNPYADHWFEKRLA